MDNSNINLFSTDANDVAMPSINKELVGDDNKLISESIDNAILNKEVKTLLIPETTDISALNYILDFSNLTTISKIQRTAIRSLKCKDGDVQIYLYTEKKGLYSVGFGDKYKLERMMPLVKQFVFEDKIDIYKNFEIGKPPQLVKSKDITQMRLNL